MFQAFNDGDELVLVKAKGETQMLVAFTLKLAKKQQQKENLDRTQEVDGAQCWCILNCDFNSPFHSFIHSINHSFIQ